MVIYMPSGKFKKGPFKGIDRVYTTNPRFIGPGIGKFKTIGKYLIRYRKPLTGVGSVGVGLGFGGLNEASNNQQQTYRATKFASYSRTKSKQYFNRKSKGRARCCECNRCCHR